MLLGVTRPRVRGWRRRSGGPSLLYGISLAGTNGFFYAALARLPLGTAVTIQFLGPLTLAAALSRRWRDLGWVALAASGVADPRPQQTATAPPGNRSTRSASCSR